MCEVGVWSVKFVRWGIGIVGGLGEHAFRGKGVGEELWKGDKERR